MLKNHIRSNMIKYLESQNQEVIREKSFMIYQNILKSNYLDCANCIHCYVSYQWEIDTNNLLQKIIDEKGFVYVPRLSNNQIKQVRIDNLFNLKKGRYGILEPVYKNKVVEVNVDLAFVPGVAFDTSGNRLGRGKGYYDKFLAGVSGIKIGLAHDLQVIENVPHQEHDIKMDYLITEKRTIQCKGK